jgi:uncharacterized protein YjiS (DUF1127 family)
MAALTYLRIVQLQHRVMFALTDHTRRPASDKQPEASNMAYVNSTRASSASYRDRALSSIAAIRAAIERRRLYSRTFHELASLSERELADLGMHRTMIAEIAREAAYGK